MRTQIPTRDLPAHDYRIQPTARHLVASRTVAASLTAVLLSAAWAISPARDPVHGEGLGGASGQGVTVFQRSAYTTVDLKDCKKTEVGASSQYVCKGLPGHGVSVIETGQRAFIGFGASPLKTRAAEQTLGPFNTPFKTNTARFPVEWRIAIRDAKPVPYAAIVKYYTRGYDGGSQVLVVIKVAGGVACHVAHIDAVATVDAIVLARQIADERAAGFDCKTAPVVYGGRGQPSP